MLFHPGQKLLFIGDSITDCGRRDIAAPYGNGYVSLVRALLLARYPELGPDLVNRGIGGDTVRHLAARWERDVVSERPDWLSVKVGINDVWRRFGDSPGEAVPLDEYRDTLEGLLRRAREATGAKLILMEPYVIEPNRSEPMRAEMDRYCAVVGVLAAEHDAVLVRTQTAFDAALAHTPAGAWADDRVHPNLPGHAVIALAWLRAAGFEL
jgi:lysophospholipase L1-like esterase